MDESSGSRSVVRDGSRRAWPVSGPYVVDTVFTYTWSTYRGSDWYTGSIESERPGVRGVDNLPLKETGRREGLVHFTILSRHQDIFVVV